MIKDEEKYYDFSGDQPLPGGPSTWHITDWDQRRVISVTMDGLQDDFIGSTCRKPTKSSRRTLTPRMTKLIAFITRPFKRPFSPKELRPYSAMHSRN